MNKIKKTALIFSFILAITTGLLNAAETVNPVATNGFIDLSHSNFNTDKTINLNGEWEFYWRSLLTPDDFKNKTVEKTGLIKLPQFWNDYYLNDKPLPGNGFATFRIQIKLPKKNQNYALKILPIHTAYILWVNGKQVAQNGVVGKTPETTKPQYLPISTNLEPAGETLELVLQVSNFSHKNGGILHPMEIGSAATIKKHEIKQVAYDLFLIGAIFIMAIYHFGLFALRKSELSPLSFGLFCSVISLRISLHGYTLILSLFPNANGELLAIIDYFTLYLGLITFLHFIKLLYPHAFSQKIFNGFALATCGFGLITILAPMKVFTSYLTYFQILIGIAGVYVIYILIRSIFEKREGAQIVLAGFLAIFLAAINDALYYQQIINTTDMVGTGLFVFIFSQSFVLSLRFSKAFQTVEILSRELEHKVKERTASIKDLLDNTGQGFLSFNRNYQIQKYTSRATRLFFNQTIENTDVLQLIFADCQNETKEALNLVFDDPGCLAMVKNLVPSELYRDEKVFQIDYHWIEGSEIQDGRIMMVLSDVTVERALKNKLEADEKQNAIILKIAVDRHGFINFLEEINRIIKEILIILASPLSDNNMGELFRLFHTIKGGMASYAFHEIAEKAHEVETAMAAFSNNQKKMDQNEMQAIKDKTVEIQLLLSNNLDALNFLLPKELLESSATNYFRIPESKITDLQNALIAGAEDHLKIKELVGNLKKQPVRNILKKFATDAKEMAEKLHKSVDVVVEGEKTEIFHAPFKQLFSSLIHLVRNSVDHGIEDPDTRLAHQKPEKGLLELKIERVDEKIHFILSDDGAGIDADKIAGLALEKGIIDKAAIENMSEPEKVRLIFKPGFSTNQQITDLSGRGVGMDAVLQEVIQLKGKILIDTTINKGTTFSISFPESSNIAS